MDQLREILTDTKGVIAKLEAAEKEKTGIKSLKVGFNKVFGYYIEVSKSYYDQVPESYIRKQTLTNCERYITQELKDMEHTILSAQDRIVALEYQLFCDIRDQVAAQSPRIQEIAGAVAQVDVLVSFATVAAENNYCMPTVDNSDRLEITEGRHPVVEKMRRDVLFVPNDTYMDNKEHLAAILTGPNMAGKSTYMRQVALMVLMAQMGSFVPARAAELYGRAAADGLLLDGARLETAVLALLRMQDPADFAQVRGVSEGLENRLTAAVREANSLDDLYTRLKTKRYPHARLRRLVLDAALGFPAELPMPPYLHVLGARKAALPRLKQASLPAATALADLARTGPEAAKISRLHNKAVDFSSLCREKIQPMGLAFTAKPVVI